MANPYIGPEWTAEQLEEQQTELEAHWQDLTNRNAEITREMDHCQEHRQYIAEALKVVTAENVIILPIKE